MGILQDSQKLHGIAGGDPRFMKVLRTPECLGALDMAFRLGQDANRVDLPSSQFVQFAIDGRHAFEFCSGQLNCDARCRFAQCLDLLAKSFDLHSVFGEQNRGGHVELFQDHLFAPRHAFGPQLAHLGRGDLPGPGRLAATGHDDLRIISHHLPWNVLGFIGVPDRQHQQSRIVGVDHSRLEIACELILKPALIFAVGQFLFPDSG